ncbi:MAG TPA: M3 family oligoendopeptidase [Anaerolineaceae bacterium]|nr:M3 family oligoendopeptidase [Anaerolineaceae bacterium]
MTESTFQVSRWSLDDLFPGIKSPQLAETFKTLEEKVRSFSEVRPQLTEGISTGAFLDLVRKVEEIYRAQARLSAYAELRFAENTQDQETLSLLAKVEQFSAELNNQVLFFELWWKNVSDETAERLMAEAGDYRYWLEQMRLFKPHTLSEPEEKIINIKNVTGPSAMNTLYDSITNRYVFKLVVDGEEKELTRGELSPYIRGADPDLRAAAYQELYRVYGNDGTILGLIYQNIVRDWRNENLNLRGYASPISVRNLVNDLPDAVIETLLEVARKNAGLFQRFFRLKARWLGMDRLRRYDIYAPVVASDKRFDYDRAANTVLDAFRQFDPRLADLVLRLFKEQRIDSEVRKGKQSGAFCAPVAPGLTPWVKLNYQGRADDVATMAHEFGHAIHSMLAEEHSLFTYHSNLPLAETASTFGEMLLIDRLLAEETDESVRRDLLFRQIDDSYATILRQAYFALFEKTAHEMVEQGASVDELSAAYMDNLREQLGDSVEISDEFKWEWASIPHMYAYPFYVYAYAFGQLLVLALYQQYRAEGEAFKPRYFRLLSAGGSEAPMRLLAEAGIDAADPAFWQGGFDVLAGLVEQLEQMPVKNG